jgi:sulfite dehydrogenase (cytochrome) subunit B
VWRSNGPGLTFLCALLAFAPRAVAEDETGIVLTEGPGHDQVRAACSMCHSLDYIVMNSPFQDKAGWEKTVTKMVKVFGAPLTAEESAAIVAYLERYYGR